MYSHSIKNNCVHTILIIALVSVCLGRTYQCLFWDIPIRSLLWNEDFFSGLVESLLGYNWEDYIKHPEANAVISNLVTGIGICIVVFMSISLLPVKNRFHVIGIIGLTLIFSFIALLYYLEKFKAIGQFFEYSLQYMTPLLYWVYKKNQASDAWKWMAKIVIALTFVSHGLYALGIYPVPGNFVAMTINILGCSNAFAVKLLMVAGILDIIASVGLLFKGRIFYWSLWYCIIWGTLTALARIVANVDFGDFFQSAHQWVYETIYRAPHFMIPLALYIAYKSEERDLIEKV